MQFQHPEILYALFLLLIPIIIHLFQLRRFQKIDFTNVAFLKKATLQTRKSSKLKKWLTLFARLMALGCIILAFAQPFSASDTALNTEKETVLYIDNSYSMQAKGANGPLLTSTLQRLYENLNGEETLSWFDNSQTKRQVTEIDIKNDILSLPYSGVPLSPSDVWLKAQQLFSNSPTSNKRFIWISDFQSNQLLPEVTNESISLDILQPKPESSFNLSIDTAFVLSKKVASLELEARISGTGELPKNAAVSLYDGNRLVAKSSAEFQGGTSASVVFDIENPNGFKGLLQLNDAQLQYDNSLHFNISLRFPIKVLSINQTNGDYLRKLFTHADFEFSEQPFNQLNYSDLSSQHFIILNELETIPVSLSNALKTYHSNGGTILIIPSVNIDNPSYNVLLNALGMGSFTDTSLSAEKKITSINFSHPLYENVFEKQVTNFQYPMVRSFYTLQGTPVEILSFEDGRPFLVQSERTYLATSAFNTENSNFTSSPLIVPTLLNMAQQSLPLPKLYYNLNTTNTFSIPVQLESDQIVHLKDSVFSIIPLQQSNAQSVTVTVTDALDRAGTYGVYLEDTPVQQVSFNYPRTESSMSYWDLDNWEGVTLHSSLDELFQSITEANQIHSLWKWFVIFAIVFLLFELFILKFL